MAQENGTTAAADPVVAWLEEIRDFEGSTDRAREMATAAIGRLSPAAAELEAPASTAGDKIGQIVDAAAAETAAAARRGGSRETASRRSSRQGNQ